MQVLITGATGFLGSSLVRASLAAGHSVVALTRRSSDTRRLSGEIGHPRLEIVAIDEESIEAVFTRIHVDAVIHTATNYGRGGRAWSTTSDLMTSNIVFPMEVLWAAIKHGTRLFVNTDSYFNKPGKTYNSLQGYSLTKKYFLDWLEHHSELISVVNMRLEHIYGPDDSADKFIPTIVDQVARQRVATFAMTAGEQTRDFIFVTDVAAAFMLVLEDATLLSGPGYEHFEIGTGAATSVRDMALAIKSLSGSPTEFEFGALPYRKDEIAESVAGRGFYDRFGFTSTVSLEAGVKSILEGIS